MVFRVVIFTLILLVFSGINHAGNETQIIDKNYIDIALAKAESFLRGEQNIDDIGSLFLKGLAVSGSILKSDIPPKDAFSRLFNEKYAFNDLAIKRSINSIKELKSLLNYNNNNFGNYFYKFNDEIQKTMVHRYDDVLARAIYCDKKSFDDIDLAILLSMRDFIGGYTDTHGLLGILFLEENKCFNKFELEKAKNSIISALVKALEKDVVVDDLYAERIACLYWAGAGHLVKKEWIDKILAAQRPNGAWRASNLLGSSVHTTGLAVLSIQYYFGYKKPCFYRQSSNSYTCIGEMT